MAPASSPRTGAVSYPRTKFIEPANVETPLPSFVWHQ
jgi:hypothetical protein